ncbi:MAG TPA: GAF domain-containing protein [Methylomirabilota bacterium]|nr:GAF domain-containing protein [Methylomirabilota bacterium]
MSGDRARRPLRTDAEPAARELEGRLTAALSQLEAARAESRRHADRVETLARLTRTISGSLDPEVILPAVAEAAVSLFPGCVCRLWTADGDRLLVRAGAGTDAATASEGWETRIGEGLIGGVAAGVKPVLVEDLAGCDLLSAAERSRTGGFVSQGLASVAALPLVVAGRAVGVAALFSRQRGALPAPDVKLLEALVDQAAVALTTARLFQDTQDRRRLTEDLYALTVAMTRTMEVQHRTDTFVERIPQALGFDRVAVMLATPDGSALELVSATGLTPDAPRRIPLAAGGGALQRVWESGETLIVSSDAELAKVPPLAPELRSHPVLRSRRFAVVPLTFREKPIGLVTADHKVSRRPVTRRGVAHLELFSQQLASSINNARLYGEARQRERDATVMFEVTRTLAATLDLDSVLDTIADGTIEALGCDAAGFYSWDAAREGLVFTRGRNLDPQITERLVLKRGEGIGGRAYAERRPVWTADRMAEAALGYSPANAAVFAERAGPRALLAAPVILRDELAGVLLAAYVAPHPWSERQVHLLSSLAAQAAVAIENARLYTAAQQNLAQAALLNEAARTLHRTLDVKRLLPDAIASLGQTFGAVGAGVVLFDEASRRQGQAIRWGEWSEEAVRAAAEPLRRREAPLLILDLSARPDVISPGLLAPGPRALAAFPVRGRSRVLGGLTLLFVGPRAVSEAETRLLAAYADQLAMALDNAALFEEAENKKTQLEQVFASTSDGFLVLDLEERIVAFNRQGGELLGIAPDEVIGRPFRRLVEALSDAVVWEDTGGQALAAALERRGEPAAGDLELRRPERRTLRWHTTPTRDLLGSTVGVTVTLRDVTREREIDRMKTEFVSTVSHELRTPLTSIKGSLHLLLSDPALELDETQRHLVDISVKNTDRLIRLITNILDISKIEAGRIQLDLGDQRPCDFVSMAVEGIRGFAESREVVLEQDVPDSLPQVRADFDRMVQVVTNLLSNAVKFSPTGGRVTVTGRLVGGELELRVSDQGCGIAPHDMSRLFRKFQQLDGSNVREVGGTGLGLVICRGIVEEHGGRIGVESQPGAGATFIVSLPAPRAEVADRGPAETSPAQAPLVLVVDDEPDLRMLLRDQLELEGFRVMEAGRALEAIELARERPPDLITMDVMLPDLDGFEAIRLLRAQPETQATPVVILSAIEVEPGDTRALGTTVYLTKPFSTAALLKAVRASLQAGKGTGA